MTLGHDSPHDLYGPLLPLGKDGWLMTTCPTQSGCQSYLFIVLVDTCIPGCLKSVFMYLILP